MTKTTVKYAAILVLLAVMISCTDYLPTGTTTQGMIELEDVTKEYTDRYGPPEDVYLYTSDDYQSAAYWWWSEGISVTFVSTTYDDTYGWRVDSVYTFTPIS